MSKGKIAVGALAALMAVAAPVVAKYEGLSLTPYKDQVGVSTVCFGETAVKMRKYTREECQKMLDGRVEEFATAVAKRNPELVGHSNQWAAATSLAYNIGISAYSKSTVAKDFSAGNWEKACKGFSSWKYAGGKVNRGLVNRRSSETSMCLKQLPPISERLPVVD